MEPISGSLNPYEWSSEGAVAYEAAVEAINAVVGAYIARIAQEEQRPEGERNASAIATWRQQRNACQREREALDAGDAGAVAEVRRQYARRLREVRGGDA
ncbi:hypothetical protein [Streptomyces sp. NPDC051219]|uniref:hypothetical protein n=1 Tax=Streptomyces sp. NPDC051219 TaxID=3155283 RepID=UPI003424FE9E